MKKISPRGLGINQAQIKALVAQFESKRHLFAHVVEQIRFAVTTSDKLKPFLHSVKYRVKDTTHLEDKILRKAQKAKDSGVSFELTKENFFQIFNDLAGFRILHLHTTQFEKINVELLTIFDELGFILEKGPWARSWDNETTAYFEKLGIAVDRSETMYTSVHYVVKSNIRDPIWCEIQVRTLMEEVWGEVDHTINYPHQSDSASCREQIKVLARVTSSCSRLVDSIFNTHEENKLKETVTKKSIGVSRKKQKKLSSSETISRLQLHQEVSRK